MSCCDVKSPTATTPEQCSSCGDVGTQVDAITLKALLTSDALRRGIPDAPRFCATEGCQIVYFDSDAGVNFTEVELTVRVHAKHPTDDGVQVCYCFDYTPSTIEAEIARSGSRSARATITAEVQAGHCACEVRNPKGSCCLGDVARVEARVQQLTHVEG